MKKHLSVVMASAMAMALLAGCGQKPAETTAAPTTAATTAAPTTAAETTTVAETTADAKEEKEEGTFKTGMAVVSSMTKSKDAGEKNGNAEVDSVAAAVVVDADGKIVSCVLDMAQNNMGFTAEGKVVKTEEFKTKKELKEEYGMKAASKIGKEWYEQAAALEEYVIGKTVEEVEGIAVDEATKPADADLAASVTVSIGDYKAAIVEAAKNAEEIGTKAGDKLGLGIITDMNKSSDATAEKEGQCQAYSTYAAVTTDADGIITSAIIDCTQGTVKFDAAGKITSDLTTGVATKKQLGEEYGMKAASKIGKEWFEQAAALEEYVVGKTVAEVEGIAVDEAEKPADADLAASVTVSIGGYQTAIAKAVANAQ